MILNSKYPFRVPYLDLSQEYEFKEENTKLITKQYAKRSKVIILDKFNNIVTVAMSEPTLKLKQLLEKKLGLFVSIFESSEKDIIDSINIAY